MCNRIFISLFTILVVLTPSSWAKQKQFMMISAKELGALPFEKRALYVSELLKFMQHLEEYQRKNGLKYYSLFNLLIPEAEAQVKRKCFYGLHIRTTTNGYCYYDSTNGEPDLTKDVNCAKPARILDKRTNTFQSSQAQMSCPQIFAVDGDAGCTKLGDGASEGCINNLRGDNPNEPLVNSEKFIKLVNKFAKCAKENLDYCQDWNDYQSGFDSICPGATRGVIQLCLEIKPFFSTLREKVGLASKGEAPAEAPVAKGPPSLPAFGPITLPPPAETPVAPPAPADPSVTVKVTPRPEAVTVTPTRPPVPAAKAPPQAAAPPPEPPKPAIKPAKVEPGNHSCSEREGGYPDYSNSFACLICPIEKHYEANTPNYKVSDRYLALVSVLEGLPCSGAIKALSPSTQNTLHMVNRFGYCSDNAYSWENKPPNVMIKKWLTSGRIKTEDPKLEPKNDTTYKRLMNKWVERHRAQLTGSLQPPETTTEEKVFWQDFGIDFLTARNLFCSKTSLEFGDILQKSKGKMNSNLFSCLQEAQQKVKQNTNCYAFPAAGNKMDQKLNESYIGQLLKQKYILRFAHGSGCAKENTCDVLESSSTDEGAIQIVNLSQNNPVGGNIVKTAEPKNQIVNQMKGEDLACKYQYSEYSTRSCDGTSSTASVQATPASAQPTQGVIVYPNTREQQSTELIKPAQ